MDRFEQDEGGDLFADLTARGTIGPGGLRLILDPGAFSEQLAVAPDRIDPENLKLDCSLSLRRRGIEAKLVFNDDAPQVDPMLLRNVAKAYAWFDEIKGGTTVREIVKGEGVTRQRVTAIIDLVFLAPDIVRRVVEGRQPVEVTSERLIKSQKPTHWSEQRATLVQVTDSQTP
ncbi:MAG: hypothetical protein AAGD13_07185 [Pseudomonadota bacterium]